MSARSAFVTRYLSRQAKVQRLSEELEKLESTRGSALRAIQKRELELSAIELQLICEGRVRMNERRK